MEKDSKDKEVLNYCIELTSNIADERIQLEAFSILFNHKLKESSGAYISVATDNPSSIQEPLNSGNDFSAIIASHIKVDVVCIQQVFYVNDDGTLGLNLSREVLAESTKAQSTKDIASMLSVAVEILEKRSVSSNEVKKIVQQLGVLDGNNFARSIKQLSPDFIITGSSHNVNIKPTPRAYIKIADTIKKYSAID